MLRRLPDRGIKAILAKGRLLLGLYPVLASCGTPLRDAQIAVPSRFEAAADPRQAADALDHWWTGFADPQLAGLVEQALRSAPDARTALAALDEARATRRVTLTRYTPQGGANVSVSVDGGSRGDAATTFLGGVSPTWEVGLFGRRAALRKTADADLDVSRFDFIATRQSLAANVAGNLFEARGYALQLVEARDTERVTGSLARIARLRADSGIGAPVDAASLDASAATAIAARQALEAQLSVSRRTLLVLTGRGTDPVGTIVIDPWLGNPPPIPAVAPGALLRRRPDILQAEARVRSAAGNLRLDELALLPSIGLSPSASATTLVSGGTSSLWSLLGNLTMPILDRRRLLANIRARRARGEQVVIAYEKTVQTAYGEAENTVTTYMADRHRLGQLIVAERRARDAFHAQQQGYRAGIVELTTLLDAERTWRNARSTLAQLRTKTLTDAVNAFLALGGGWSPTSTDRP